MTETFEPGEPFIYRKAPGVYELGVGTAYNVPDCLRDLRVIGVRATDWMVDIEVCDA